MMNEVTLKVKQFLDERGWNKLHPSDVAKSIVIESAELLEHFQWDDKDIAKTKADPQFEEIKHELADVMIYCLDMCILLDLDPDEIIKAKLEIAKAKYPPAKVMTTVRPGTDDGYLEIKKGTVFKKSERLKRHS